MSSNHGTPASTPNGGFGIPGCLSVGGKVHIGEDVYGPLYPNGIAARLSYTPVSTNFTTAASGKYAVDTTAGVITATLPFAPTAGQVVELCDAKGTFSTNALTVARNGQPINGTAADYVASTRQKVFFVYIDATQGWTSYSYPSNLSGLQGYTSTATSGGTTTLTAASTVNQRFTGNQDQTILLPSTATLNLGFWFTIHNDSTGTLQIKTSTGVDLVTVISGVTVNPLVISTANNLATAWDRDYVAFNSILGTGSVVLSRTPSAGQLLVGNAGGTAFAPVVVSGDATLSSAGVVSVPSLATKLPLATRVPRRVVLLGDSITDLNGGPRLDGSSTFYSAQGFWNWANVQMGFRYAMVVNAGVSGNKVAQMDTRFATDVAAYTPDVVVVFGGINDVVTISSLGADTNTVVASVKASLASIYDKVLALGAICVVSPMTPMSEASGTIKVLTANEKIAWASINQWIREQAKSRPLMVLADMSEAITDKTLNARPVNDTVSPGTQPSILYDGLHPAANGAMLMGRALADAMIPLAPPANPYLVGVNSVNYLTNAGMIGASGATGPTSWNTSDVGGGAVMAFSYIARTDGIAGNWLRADLTGSSNHSPTIKFFQGATYSGAIGDKVKFVVEFQCEDQVYSSGTEIRNIVATIQGSGATVLTGCLADGFFTSGNASRVCSNTLFHPASGVLETPPCIWTGTTTYYVVTVFMTGKTIWRIGRVACVKV